MKTNNKLNHEKVNTLSLSLSLSRKSRLKLKPGFNLSSLLRALKSTFSSPISHSPSLDSERRINPSSSSTTYHLPLRQSSGSSTSTTYSKAFTIVELLVVIVVIGILAAITVIAYTGVSGKAVTASLQSGLTNAKKQLSLYYVDHGSYPSGIDGNNCPTLTGSAPTPDTRYCFKPSSGNTYAYSSSDPYQTYILDATNTNNTTYRVTNSSNPVAVTTTPISAIAAISGTTTAIGNTLIAGALTPSVATVTYQWQSATTVGGTYTNISGATSSTYVLIVSDFGKYIKVVVTGTGSYTGTQTSTASAVVSDTNWLAIGTQVWAKANLNVGTRIAGASAQTNNSTLEKYCYGDTDANCTTYGGLYQWDEAMQYVTTAGAQGVCPAGSHIPTDAEYKTLEMQLGMSQATADTTGWRGTTEGTQLKSGGTSGLNVPLAGYRSTDGSFGNLSSNAYLWSSSESSTSAWTRDLNSGFATVNRTTCDKGYGFSVRCLGN